MESEESEAKVETMIGKKRSRPLNESLTQPANRRSKKQADGTEKIIVEAA
jgi:hypothetical protein